MYPSTAHSSTGILNDANTKQNNKNSVTKYKLKIQMILKKAHPIICFQLESKMVVYASGSQTIIRLSALKSLYNLLDGS